jgi:hypothetical protein
MNIEQASGHVNGDDGAPGVRVRFGQFVDLGQIDCGSLPITPGSELHV